MTVVEMPARRSGPGARSGLRESGCGLCGALVRRAGAAMELPTVPRTSDVIAVETAFAEWPTDVVADIRHRAELPISERDGNGGGCRLAALQRRPRKVLGAADVDPVLFIGHGVPPMLVLVVRPLTPAFHVNPFDRGDRSPALERTPARQCRPKPRTADQKSSRRKQKCKQ